MNKSETESLDGIAIIGMAGQFPGAKTIDEFWHNIREGVESISFFSEEELKLSGIDPELIRHPQYVKARGVLDEIEGFDAAFFGFNPREAEITDPQHRLFLEQAFIALETAGYNSENYEGSIGVYAGASGLNTYFLNNLYSNPEVRESVGDYQLFIANDKDFLSTRVSYKLNLKGPSIAIQTACSTSLVAVTQACQSLLSYQCDMALAGAVAIGVPQKTGYLYKEGMILSPDGHCRAFDAKARGTVSGSGVGIVLLKRLEEAIADGDTIHAVIKGFAINNDGAGKVGYTAPSVEGQAEAIAQALGLAEFDPETITYVEAHGTGTPLGDPIEIAALTQAFGTGSGEKYCAIGSLKTNIGHLDTAAGVAGLIKTVQALKHQLIPPSLHFESPNPQIDFANSPFYVNTTLSEWTTNGTPRRAGVSSFGVGGTNAHVVLEEAPILELSGESRPYQLLLLSAKTSSALDTATQNLAEYLQQHPDVNLADVAYTLQVGRRVFGHRRMVVCQDLNDAAIALSTLDSKRVFTSFQESKDRPVAFMFSGQGSQYVNMGWELYQVEPTFREAIDRCSELLKPLLGFDLTDILYTSQEKAEKAAQKLQETAIAQPAIFAIEYALAQLWMSWGVKPVAAIGHSLGEYVAACLAGVFSLEDALKLVADRGKMMQQMPAGTMLAIPLSDREVQPLLGNELSLATINGPSLCVVSGTTEAIAQLHNQLAEKGVECRRLHTSHAFHSAMMEPMLDAFSDRVKKVNLHPPQLPYLSNVTGTWITAAEATDPNYWARHLRQTVLFSSGLEQLLKHPDWILLEVGPGQTLTTLSRRHPDKVAEQIVVSSLRHPQESIADVAFLLNALGKLWATGVQVNWSEFYAAEKRYRIPLPTYPFERQRYWIELQKQAHQNTVQQKLVNSPERASLPIHSRPELTNTYVAPRNDVELTITGIWQELLGIERVGIYDDYFELGGDSLLAIQILSRMRDIFKMDVISINIVEAPTIAKLAAVVSSAISSHQPNTILPPSSLVKIQEGSSNHPPLFCVHAAGGTVMCYVDLARYLGQNQPFYGLQSPILYGEIGEDYGKIEELAAHYIKAIKTVQPEGPYLLGGYSYGGSVAFEMAVQLQKQGDRVALLALFDSLPPISYAQEPPDDITLLAGFMWMIGLLYAGKELQVPYDELRQIPPDRQLNYLLDRLSINKILPPNMEFDIRRFYQVWKNNHQALNYYRPQHIYPNRISVFRATEHQNQQLKELMNLMNINRSDGIEMDGWGKLSSELIKIYDVPGSHLTILNEPHVQILAEKLKQCLDELRLTDEANGSIPFL